VNTHEYQAREVLARYGVPFASGVVAETCNEVQKIARELGGKVIVKAQIHAGGRGKAGGVKLAGSPEEAREHACTLLGSTIKGHIVRKVLVARVVPIAKEFYLGVLLDRGSQRSVVMMASAVGGVDIEEVAATSPDDIARAHVDALIGLAQYQTRDLAVAVDLKGDQGRQFAGLAEALYTALVECDCSLVELNPVALTPDGQLVALDAKMVLDHNALFRHPDLAALRDVNEEANVEVEAREKDITYVKLDGDIGCMVNGAGLAMATMDLIELHGGKAANFLDFGGGPSMERVGDSLDFILADPNVRAIFVNIFGGITRCDLVAQALLDHINAGKIHVPVVARLIGTNSSEGRQLLMKTPVKLATTLSEAAEMVVSLARGGNELGVAK
jgi:succinyl-CoA synthetase beta subunit